MSQDPLEASGQSAFAADKQEVRGVKAVLFDLGNVLIDFEHRRAAESISCFTERSVEEIFNLFFDSELTGLFEEGKISGREFFLEVRRMLNLEMDFHQFVPIWNEIFFFSEKNQGVYQLATRLKSTYKVAILSNINILHLEYIKRTFPLLGAFTMMASNEVGLRKPHPDIYRKALALLDEPGENVFYTDDRAELVTSASQLGLRSFVFKSVDGLRNDLLQAGVNIL